MKDQRMVKMRNCWIFKSRAEKRAALYEDDIRLESRLYRRVTVVFAAEWCTQNTRIPSPLSACIPDKRKEKPELIRRITKVKPDYVVGRNTTKRNLRTCVGMLVGCVWCVCVSRRVSFFFFFRGRGPGRARKLVPVSLVRQAVPMIFTRPQLLRGSDRPLLRKAYLRHAPPDVISHFLVRTEQRVIGFVWIWSMILRHLEMRSHRPTNTGSRWLPYV